MKSILKKPDKDKMMRRASKVYRETIRTRQTDSPKSKRKVTISEKEEVFDPNAPA